MPAVRSTPAPSASGTPWPSSNVQAHTERVLLVITGIAVIAFAVSFVLGVRLPAPRSGGASPDSIAAHDFLNRGRPPRDRKSTRLNSSHVKISYAVFCLKKKKENEDTD